MIDYTQWQPDPFLLSDAEIVQDYAEWSGEDPFDVTAKIMAFQTRTASEYHALGQDFYTKSENYIYDILGGNPSAGVRANLLNKFLPGCIEYLKNADPRRTFADFGGGVGAVCQIMHTFCQKQVTYIDIQSKTTDFALWRFKKYGWDINSVIIPLDDMTLPQQYDILFTDAVWEHLSPATQIDYAKRLPAYITNSGNLYFLVDLSGHSDLMPMHFDVDIAAVHDAIEGAGMTCQYGHNTFASKWIKNA